VTRVEPDAAQCPGDVYWKRFDCCVQSVNELLEEDSGSAPDAAPAPGYLACCQTIVAVANDPMEADAASVFNGRAVFTCCDVLGASGISTRLPDGSFGACDPWGPPVPPEMPGHLMDWQEVA